MKGLVYFFHNGTRCKIGYTTKPVGVRLSAGNVWSPDRLNLLGWIESEFPDKLEKAIHLRLAQYNPRRKGEWFDLTIAQSLKVIKEYENANICHKHYRNAPGHPAHTVRPLCGRQHNQAENNREVQHGRKRGDCFTRLKRLLTVDGTKHGFSGGTFLRKAPAEMEGRFL